MECAVGNLCEIAYKTSAMTPTVELRNVTADDVPTLFEHQNDPVVRSMAVIPHWPRDEFQARWEKHLANDAVCKRAIWADGQLVGSILSFDRNGLREVGYAIGRTHWGKGIGSAALRQFLSCELARPLTAVVSAHNLASLQVAQKCGFVISGERRQTAENGEQSSLVILTLSDST